MSAQSGNVNFSIESFDELTPVPTPYSDFASKLYLFEIGSKGTSPSILFLRDFNVHVQPADTGVEDSVPVFTLISEYLGLNFDGAGNLNEITENGFLAMQLPIEGTNGTVSSFGPGIAGFVRTNANPSTLGATSSPGYFDGLNGTMSWNIQATGRVVQFIGSGANYDPTFTFNSFAGLSHSDALASIENLDFAISSSSTEQWNFISSNLRLDDNLTGTDPYFTFRGALQLNSLPSDEALSTLPGSATIKAESFQYSYYILELIDDSDFDGDGIPDFVDLTGFANPNALAKPNHASEQHGFSSWFYSPFFDAWFWSSESDGDWDYSLTLGWVFDPTTGGTFDPDNFWFYINTPAGNTNDFGWVWTSQDVQPWIYRSSDPVWLELKSSAVGQSTFFNLSTNAEETLNF
jgi:hypothetical protein|tara:strand:+ start:1140 stop:2357 length:1218 start_codon:yes stop_codon:yes gene_type:complete